MDCVVFLFEGENMERVMIIGCGGAGKSTLARQLGEKTGLPVVHLDQIWWAPGNWQHISQEEFDRQLAWELEKPCWILDGNFNRTLEARLDRCDTVIYLDRSRFTCLIYWIKRVIQNWGHARQDMAPGCSEHFDPDMANWIWNFNRINRARNYDLLEKHMDKQIYILKSNRDIRRFWREFDSREEISCVPSGDMVP